jgi:hypothetical protein
LRRPIPALILALAACGTDKAPSENERALAGVGAVVILSRAPRLGGVGDVFQYTSYAPGAKLTKLEPPTADGKRTTLCCDQFPEMAGLDIQSFDVSFDARSIVFSGRIEGDARFGLYVLTLNDRNEAAAAPRHLGLNPMHDHVYPVFAPRERIIFVTNEVVEPGAKQHRDEYERGETTQLASISVDGTDLVLGPRNLSHRVAPTLLADGRVLFTQWDHLGDMNAGHLMISNPDFTALREAFGKEGGAGVNSYLKAVEVEPGRLLAIGTSRDRTLQSGKVLDIRLGALDGGVMRMSESRASATDLTPQVPAMEASSPTVGRYYSAHPVRRVDGGFGDKPLVLVSWADGPVEQGVLGEARVPPDFGVYLLDSATGQRLAILNDPATWDVSPRPLAPRAAPPAIEDSAKNGLSDQSLLIGSLDVRESSTNPEALKRGDVVAVRVLEGFSTEEGVPDDFGLTEHEGAAMLGEAKVHADGSWAALVPANVPIHLQPIDRHGMAIVNEPVWFSGRPGESRFCGGCHEDRAATTVVQPGITMAMATRPPSFDRPRAERRSNDFSMGRVVGVPWDKALQPIFDAKCVSCHEGTAGAANKSLTFTDEMNNKQTFVFDLRGGPTSLNIGGEMISGYSASHLSLLGPMMGELAEEGITVTGDLLPQIEPGNARGSRLFQKLNPPEILGDGVTRLRPGMPVHPVDVGGQELTRDELYLLILMADAGGQFYSRENAPGGSGYGE